MSWKNELSRVVRGRFREDEPLSKHTTFRIGGPCDVFFDPVDVDDLVTAVRFLRNSHVPHIFTGQGSNLLFADSGYRGCIVKVGPGLRKSTLKKTRVEVGAGVLLHPLIKALIEKEMGGIESLIGIPGTIGGAIYMNAGAWGQAISDKLQWVEVIDGGGDIRRLNKENIIFKYRWSLFQDLTEWVILSAGFEFDRTPASELNERIRVVNQKRKKTQPWNYPSPGSFFKNPSGNSAGALIDRAGLKGERVGGAMVSDIHANFIVNAGGATCDDVLALSDKIRRTVIAKFNVELEPEVRVITS